MTFDRRAPVCYTVIGVAENGRMDRVIEDPKPMFYLPLGQLPAGTGLSANYVVIRAADGQVGNVATSARELLRKEFPAGTPIIRAMDDRLEPQYRPWRLGATLFTAFGVLALVVAVVGIYSTVSYGESASMNSAYASRSVPRSGNAAVVIIGGVRTVAIDCVRRRTALAGKLVAPALRRVAERSICARAHRHDAWSSALARARSCAARRASIAALPIRFQRTFRNQARWARRAPRNESQSPRVVGREPKRRRIQFSFPLANRR